MAQKILIIDGHPDPNPERLCHALADAYAKGGQEGGHEVRTLWVSKIEFPILRTKEDFENGLPVPDIKSAQENIYWADHILIVYPLWLGTMPALLKAFLEQTIRPNFAFEATNKKWPIKHLSGRTCRIVITMGMPGFLYRWFFLAHSLKSLERNILKFTGVKPTGETLFGMVEAVSEEKRAGWLKKMEVLGRKAG